MKISDEVICKIHEIIEEVIDTDRLHLDETFDLVNDIGLTSLDMVEITMSIEEEFDIDITDEQTNDWVTLDQVYNTVTELLIGRES